MSFRQYKRLSKKSNFTPATLSEFGILAGFCSFTHSLSNKPYFPPLIAPFLILFIDNYDSFTWNLVDIIRRFQPVKVVRNDEIELPIVTNIEGIVISPGPGKPADGKMSYQIVKHYVGKLPILGVCLGHQIIGEVLGAKVVHAQVPMHGKVSAAFHRNQSIFRELSNPIQVMRYHSLILQPQSLPRELEVSAWTATGEIMGIQHKEYPLTAVQFHPESILSDEGEKLIQNWLEDVRNWQESNCLSSL